MTETFINQVTGAQAPVDPFDAIEAQPEDYLRAPAVVPLSPAVLRQAQRAWEGVPRKDGSITHVVSHTFTDTDEKTIRLFMRQLRSAGEKVSPDCVITVTRDGSKVIWRASKRRKRPSVDTQPAAQ